MRFDERSGRDPQTTALLRRFACDGVPEEARSLALACYDLAVSAVDRLPDSPELSASLWLLVGARDFMVQATEPPASRRSTATVHALRSR